MGTQQSLLMTLILDVTSGTQSDRWPLPSCSKQIQRQMVTGTTQGLE